MTTENAAPEPPKVTLARTAMALLAAGDTFRAIEFITSHEAALALEVCATLQGQLYWQKKDVRLSTTIARAGVQHGLTEAARTGDPARAEALRGQAKGLAYNIGSFNWPGWDEPGVEIGSGEVAEGFDGARLNLRLAAELKKGDLPMSRAHWLVGAYQLAMHDTVAAATSFKDAAEAAARAGAMRDQLLNVGYTLIAALCDSPHDARLHGDFEAFKGELSKQKDGADDVAQLGTALRVFSRRPT